MKVDLFNINEFIRVNGCKEVTSRFYLDSDGRPASDGLFSTEIFGRIGSEDRKFKFAFIDLKRKFMHPLVYNVVYNMFRALPSVISGEKSCSVTANGNIKVEDDLSKGETGIDFFVKNWKRIKWTTDGVENASRSKKENLLNMLTFDEVFIDKFLVIPAYYRDVNFNTSTTGTKITVDGVNTHYIKLLTATSSASITFTSAFNTQSTIQKTLNDIYVELTTKISGKTGVIRQTIMGKSIDYSAIAVLSCPRMEANTPDEQQVKYNEYGIPIAFALSLYYPFALAELEQFFHELEFTHYFAMGNGKGVVKKETDLDILDSITTDALKDMVDGFIKDKTKTYRTRPIYTLIRKNTKNPNLNPSDFEPMRIEYMVRGEVYSRLVTITDLMYAVAFNITRNKYLIATRYPVTGPESVITCKPVVLSTERVGKVVPREGEDNTNGCLSYITRPEYKIPFFPADEKGYAIDKKIKWIDTAIPNIAHLAGLGGDFDGDTMRVLGLFSIEANAEAKKLIESPMNYVSTKGEFIRGLQREGALALYMLTKP